MGVRTWRNFRYFCANQDLTNCWPNLISLGAKFCFSTPWKKGGQNFNIFFKFFAPKNLHTHATIGRSEVQLSKSSLEAHQNRGRTTRTQSREVLKMGQNFDMFAKLLCLKPFLGYKVSFLLKKKLKPQKLSLNIRISQKKITIITSFLYEWVSKWAI